MVPKAITIDSASPVTVSFVEPDPGFQAFHGDLAKITPQLMVKLRSLGIEPHLLTPEQVVQLNLAMVTDRMDLVEDHDAGNTISMMRGKSVLKDMLNLSQREVDEQKLGSIKANDNQESWVEKVADSSPNRKTIELWDGNRKRTFVEITNERLEEEKERKGEATV
jgi:hypothetical protein